MGKPMGLKFEWDKKKAIENYTKHGVTFEEAATAFADPLSRTIYDPDHSDDEDRFILLGETQGKKLVVVAHTDRNDTIRIISARKASRREGANYEKS
jgi:uncharacterized DUF497 family protein